MTLTLNIENYDQLENGGPTWVVLDGRGGCVGRKGAMDWVLPDPGRHISSHHFDITYRDGAYWLTDVSMNGTFLQGQGHRLQGEHRLATGDRLIVGHYVIGVDVATAVRAAPGAPPSGQTWALQGPALTESDPWEIGGSPLPPVDPMPAPPDRHDRFGEVVREFVPLQQPGPGPGSGHSDLQQPGPMTGGPSELRAPPSGLSGTAPLSVPPGMVGQSEPDPAPAGPIVEVAQPYAPPPPRAPEPLPAPVPGPGADLGATWGGLAPGGAVTPGSSLPPVAMPTPGFGGVDPMAAHGAHPLPRSTEPPLPPDVPVPTAMPQPPPVPAQGLTPMTQQDPASAAFVRSFCEGAGIDPTHAAGLAPEVLAYELGRAVKAASDGVIRMLIDRSKVKEFTRAGDRTMTSAEGNNPLKFLLGQNEALEAMFVRPRPGYMSGVQGFANALDDLSRHQAAVFAALQPALAEVLDGLSPDDIEAAAQASTNRFGPSRRGRNWEMFVERWDARANAGEHGMLDAFLKAFARVYQEAISSGRPGAGH